MAVFPESMNRLNRGNTEESLATIENYIRYMTERIEKATSALSNRVGALEDEKKEE